MLGMLAVLAVLVTALVIAAVAVVRYKREKLTENRFKAILAVASVAFALASWQGMVVMFQGIEQSSHAFFMYIVKQ